MVLSVMSMKPITLPSGAEIRFRATSTLASARKFSSSMRAPLVASNAPFQYVHVHAGPKSVRGKPANPSVDTPNRDLALFRHAMRWIQDRGDSKEIHHVLTADAGEPMAPALAEYWRRILTDGASLRPGDRASLGFEILPRESADDEPGKATANFHTSQHDRYEGSDYVLRSDHYTLLEGP